MIDRIDAVGLAGLALIGAGVWGLAGWAWCSILLGVAAAGLYLVREYRAIVRG